MWLYDAADTVQAPSDYEEVSYMTSDESVFASSPIAGCNDMPVDKLADPETPSGCQRGYSLKITVQTTGFKPCHIGYCA